MTPPTETDLQLELQGGLTHGLRLASRELRPNVAPLARNKAATASRGAVCGGQRKWRSNGVV